nr:RHS repeat-associated core domain-containing protein [Vibrio vulnificus]
MARWFGKVNKPCGAITNNEMRFLIMVLEKTPTMMSSTVTCVTKGNYDADSGQYLSPDPIGFAGGLRPQAYVFNPLEWVDPLGLTPLNQGGFSVYGLFEEGAELPYYIGISNNPSKRELQHLSSGRLTTDDRLEVLEKDLIYAQARGYEQAYIEEYGTKTGIRGQKISIANRGNKINSFDKGRVDDRGIAFNDEYDKAKADINSRKPKKDCF